MNKQTIVIIVLALIILVGAGVYGYKVIESRAYNLGFQDATLYINNQVVSNLIQNGYINVLVPANDNSTYQVKLIINESRRIK